MATQVNKKYFYFVVALYLVAIRFLGIVDSEFGARGNPLGVSIYIAAPLPAVKKNPFVLINCIFLIAVSGIILKKFVRPNKILSISAAVASCCILALVWASASTSARGADVSKINSEHQLAVTSGIAMGAAGTVPTIYSPQAPEPPGAVQLQAPSQFNANRLILDWVKVAAVARNVSSERVLVVQTAGFSKYRALLDATRPTNEAYALRNGYDYLSASGIFFGTKESHSTFNKAFLLELALARNEHDVLLSLDADAMVVDPLFAPAVLLPNHGPNATLLAASRGGTDEPHTWDVNAGVLVWNLRHPRAQEVSAAWAAECRDAVMRGGNDDQMMLHRVLQTIGPEDRKSLLNVFIGHDAIRINYDGVHVKHFIRPDPLDWTGDSVPARVEQIGQLARKLRLPTHSMASNHRVAWTPTNL
jgi:hypothetical protein